MSGPRHIHDELVLGPTLDGTASPPPDEEQVVTVQQHGAMPARIGRYVVLRRLGEGGMGVVYSAYDADLDRKVAIKVVRGNHRQGSLGRARMMREAQAMAQVSHSNVAHVYEVGESDGQLYIAMEFVAGMPLCEWQAKQVRENPQTTGASVQAILRLYVQAAQGLYAAHQLGIVHRDIAASKCDENSMSSRVRGTAEEKHL